MLNRNGGRDYYEECSIFSRMTTYIQLSIFIFEFDGLVVIINRNYQPLFVE